MISQFVQMKWMLDLSIEEPIKHLCFNSSKVFQNMFITVTYKYGKQQYITLPILASIVKKIKNKCIDLVFL